MLILNFQVISEITLPSLLILALYLRLWHNEGSLHTMFALQGSLFVFLFPAFGVQHIMLNHKQNIVDYHHNSQDQFHRIDIHVLPKNSLESHLQK